MPRLNPVVNYDGTYRMAVFETKKLDHDELDEPDEPDGLD